MITNIVFYVFSVLLVASASMVVISKNPVRSALFLVLAFFASAALWLLVQAEFLALILIIVYVGAVMTLFLFVVMMLNVDLSALKEGYVKYLPIGVGVVALMLAMMIMIIGPHKISALLAGEPTLHPAHHSNISDLGHVLYTDYVYGFELAAVLLLVAIIAAISLVHRPAHARKSQVIADQLKVDPKRRVKLVNLKSGE